MTTYVRNNSLKFCPFLSFGEEIWAAGHSRSQELLDNCLFFTPHPSKKKKKGTKKRKPQMVCVVSFVSFFWKQSTRIKDIKSVAPASDETCPCLNFGKS
jgi:hypothetical protein